MKGLQMKTILAHGVYTVSFNCAFNDISCGEEDRYSVDFAGDDVDALAAEVIADSPDYPMIFKRLDSENGVVVVGAFYSEDDPDYPEALMVLSVCF
jgi:hypothetical protein